MDVLPVRLIVVITIGAVAEVFLLVEAVGCDKGALLIAAFLISVMRT